MAKLKVKVVDSDDPAHLEATRKEVNKMMVEMKHKMQLQIDAQISADKETRVRDIKQLEEAKNKVPVFKFCQILHKIIFILAM